MRTPTSVNFYSHTRNRAQACSDAWSRHSCFLKLTIPQNNKWLSKKPNQCELAFWEDTADFVGWTVVDFKTDSRIRNITLPIHFTSKGLRPRSGESYERSGKRHRA